MKREKPRWKRRVGCGLWLVGLVVAVFVGEWLLLWLVIRTVSRERLVSTVITVVVATVIVGCLLVYCRVQRRME